MRFSTAIKRLTDTYNKALKNEHIKKPISWSLYQVWKWSETYEPERKIKEELDTDKL